MVVHAKKPVLTPEEYLLREREAEVKSEYWDGVLVAMAGGSKEHECISDDIHGMLYAQLLGKDCRAFRGISVHLPAYNRYVYPDVSVACQPQYVGLDGIDVLVNPVLVVEVLSKSTALADLTTKRDGYASLPSLLTYVVVSQDSPRIEVFNKQPDGTLRGEMVIIGLEANLSLPAIRCELALADIYRSVEFPSAAEEPSAGGQ